MVVLLRFSTKPDQPWQPLAMILTPPAASRVRPRRLAEPQRCPGSSRRCWEATSWWFELHLVMGNSNCNTGDSSISKWTLHCNTRKWTPGIVKSAKSNWVEIWSQWDWNWHVLPPTLGSWGRSGRNCSFSVPQKHIRKSGVLQGPKIMIGQSKTAFIQSF